MLKEKLHPPGGDTSHMSGPQEVVSEMEIWVQGVREQDRRGAEP